MKSFRKLLVGIPLAAGILCSLAAPTAANEPGYIYVRNYTDSDIIVYIDGYETNRLYKGYYEWYQTTAGHHKVETRKPHDPYHFSKHLVGCNPRGQIWVEETDFY